MELRPELLPPLVSPQRLAEIRTAIEEISALIDRGEPVDAAIAAFNSTTGHDYNVDVFANYWRSRSLDDFATEAARPARPRPQGVTSDELEEIVRRIMAADQDIDYYLRLLEATVAHPRVADLIFHDELSAAEVVQVALNYRPIT